MPHPTQVFAASRRRSTTTGPIHGHRTKTPGCAAPDVAARRRRQGRADRTRSGFQGVVGSARILLLLWAESSSLRRRRFGRRRAAARSTGEIRAHALPTGSRRAERLSRRGAGDDARPPTHSSSPEELSAGTPLPASFLCGRRCLPRLHRFRPSPAAAKRAAARVMARYAPGMSPRDAGIGGAGAAAVSDRRRARAPCAGDRCAKAPQRVGRRRRYRPCRTLATRGRCLAAAAGVSLAR